MDMNNKKDATASATANGTGRNITDHKYITTGGKRQVYTGWEIEKMREEADLLHSAIFDLESAAKTIKPVEPYASGTIELVAKDLREQLETLEEILTRYDDENDRWGHE